MKRINKRPYTMVEVLAVCVIIMILLGIGAGGYAFGQAKIKESRTKAQITRIKTALENCKAKYGFYPPGITTGTNQNKLHKELFGSRPATGFTSAVKESYFKLYAKNVDFSSISVNSDGYVVDAYQQPLVYKCPGTENRGSFDLYSLGPDGKDTADDKADNIK